MDNIARIASDIQLSQRSMRPNTSTAHSIQQNINILNDYAADVKPAVIMAKFQLSYDDFERIISKREKFVELIGSDYYRQAELLPLLNGIYPYMEKILYCWHSWQPATIPGTVLSAKALEILELIGEKQGLGKQRPFKATHNWATAFRKRYHIVNYPRHVQNVRNTSMAYGNGAAAAGRASTTQGERQLAMFEPPSIADLSNYMNPEAVQYLDVSVNSIETFELAPTEPAVNRYAEPNGPTDGAELMEDGTEKTRKVSNLF